jgi:hypothetical protein
MELVKIIGKLLYQTFKDDKVFSYYLEYKEVEPKVDKYFVYSLEGTTNELYADNTNFLEQTTIRINFYYRKQDNNYELINKLKNAFKNAGFSLIIGDIDIGFANDPNFKCKVFEFLHEAII